MKTETDPMGRNGHPIPFHGIKISSHPIPWDVKQEKKCPMGWDGMGWDGIGWDCPIPFGALVWTYFLIPTGFIDF